MKANGGFGYSAARLTGWGSLMVAVILIPLVIGLVNYEFFYQVNKEIDQGAVWHYVGPQDLDPRAKSLPLQNVQDGEPVGKPFILWKLRLER